MMRWLRRFLLLGLLGGGGYAGYTAWKRKTAEGASSAPSWPPFESTAPMASQTATTQPFTAPAHPAGQAAPTAVAAINDVSRGPAEARWVAPVDGQCPEGYPIKANDNSGIFHVIGGRFYARTVPERCYASAADAEVDGYRPAKA
jgi:hypothetical protein